MDERRYKIVRQKAYKKIIYLDSQSAIQLNTLEYDMISLVS